MFIAPKAQFPKSGFSGGRGCLGEGRLGLSGQVWEFRFLPSFPSFPRENAVQKQSGKTPGLSGTSVWRPQSRYTVMRNAMECRIEFPQNQRCRAKIALHPPKSKCRTFLRTPPVAGRGPRRGGGASRRAGGGYRGTFGFRKRIALQGGVAAAVTPIALLCATKRLEVPDILLPDIRGFLRFSSVGIPYPLSEASEEPPPRP